MLYESKQYGMAVYLLQPVCQDLTDSCRYTNYTMGCFTFFMFICRFFLFHLFESPKFLLSKGRQRDAVTSVRGIAHYNGAKTWLTEEVLDEIGGKADQVDGQTLSTMEIVKRNAGKFSTQRIKPLFAYRKLGINTALLWFMWTAIGMGEVKNLILDWSILIHSRLPTLQCLPPPIHLSSRS